MPFLHRPTFERHLRDGLHFRDQAFASVLLCLCACASRYSDDPRVLLEGTTAWHSSGWKWFSQVQRLRQSLMGPPLLYDVQMYVVRHHFLTTCVGGAGCADPRVMCAARVLVLAGVLGSSVLLDDGRCRSAAHSRCWKAPQEGV